MVGVEVLIEDRQKVEIAIKKTSELRALILPTLMGGNSKSW